MAAAAQRLAPSTGCRTPSVVGALTTPRTGLHPFRVGGWAVTGLAERVAACPSWLASGRACDPAASGRRGFLDVGRRSPTPSWSHKAPLPKSPARRAGRTSLEERTLGGSSQSEPSLRSSWTLPAPFGRGGEDRCVGGRRPATQPEACSSKRAANSGVPSRSVISTCIRLSRWIALAPRTSAPR